LHFGNRRFRTAHLGYVEAFARRYPWIESYTLFNEPFSTLFQLRNVNFRVDDALVLEIRSLRGQLLATKSWTRSRASRRRSTIARRC
jgi:hypothetical protein